jgi:diguanylate cyclase (GGDEF)-like protein
MFAPRSRLQFALLGLLCVAVLQIAVPTSWVGVETKAWTYLLVVIYALVLAVAGLMVHRPARALGWSLVVAGFGGWVLGDVVWTFEQYVFDVGDAYPLWSDAVYLPSYVVLAAGLVAMIRTQKVSTALGSILDIVIIATGASVFVASAVIIPLISAAGTSTFAKLVSSAYPIGDLVLLVAVAQLWTSPAVKSRSYMLLMLSLVASFVPDLIWNSISLTDFVVPDDITNACWLIVYVLVAAATCDPSMRLLGQSGVSAESAVTARRLTLLAVGLLMPAAALLVKVSTENIAGLRLIGVGALVLSVFALLRMATLLNVVQAQAVQLAALASCDPLTGAPNRRRWDHELSTACQVSKDEGTAVCVAMIDLDNFKRFNDKHGHQAGDLLLREAVAAWTEVLGDRGMLARYGGEEFAVLLPRMDVDDAVNVLYAMRGMTPSDQTFSAGVTRWQVGTEPALALAHADRGLYNAKRAGRDRIVAYPDTGVAAVPTIPTPSIVVQPIVDLSTGEVVAHEALSRFGDKAPEAVFHLASTGGYADVLEGTAIAAALALPGRPPTDLHVNASTAAMRSERFWALVPMDLSGVVVEISEQYDGADLPALCDAVARLRVRGAKIAADDLGSGSHELLRLAALQPDVVKLDRSLVSGCAADPGQQAVIRGGLAFVQSLGSTLCAEGVDNLEDLAYLRSIGVELAQCFLLGRPSPTWSAPYVALPFEQTEPLR